MTHFCRSGHCGFMSGLGISRRVCKCLVGKYMHGRTDSHPTHTQDFRKCSAQACMHRAKKGTHSRDVRGSLKTSIAECVTYSPCSTDGSSLDTTEESDLVGCWTRAHVVPAPQGQQQGSMRHSTKKAAKDGNCNQQCHTGACFHLAPLHAAFDRFATRHPCMQLLVGLQQGNNKNSSCSLHKAMGFVLLS